MAALPLRAAPRRRGAMSSRSSSWPGGEPGAPPGAAARPGEREVDTLRLAGDLRGALERLARLGQEACAAQRGARGLEELAAQLLAAAPEGAVLREERLHAAWLADTTAHVSHVLRSRAQAEELKGELSRPRLGSLSEDAQGAAWLALVEVGLRLRRKCLSIEPHDARLKTLVARSLSSQAALLHARGDAKTADEAHLEALRLFAELALSAALPPRPAGHGKAPAAPGQAPGAKARPDNAQDPQTPDSAFAEDDEGKDEDDEICDFRAFVEGRLAQVSARLRDEAQMLYPGASSAALGGAMSDPRPRCCLVLVHEPPPVPPGQGQGQDRGRARAKGSDAATPGALPARGSSLGSVRSALDAEELPMPIILDDCSPSASARKGAVELRARALEAAKSRDTWWQHVPRTVDLDPRRHELVLFGRQSYEETVLGGPQRRSADARAHAPQGGARRTGYVRLDSRAVDGQISRRHAQLKLTRVHPLLPRLPWHKDDKSPSPRLFHSSDSYDGPDDDSDTGSVVEVEEAPEQAPGAEDRLDVTLPPAQGGELRDSRGDAAGSPLAGAADATKRPAPHGQHQRQPYEYAWVIRDLASTNGVLVNGVRVQEHPLKHGDVVSFGGGFHVQLGSAVTTHKRAPAFCAFVYRFELLEHGEAERADDEAQREAHGGAAKGTMLQRLVHAFQAAAAQPGADRSAERLHFALLYAALVAQTFPDRAAEADVPTLLQASQRLFQRAAEANVPFAHWGSWLRAEARPTPRGASDE